MSNSRRRSLVRLVPKQMRSGRGRNVSVVVAAFATVAALAMVLVRGRRHLAIADS